MASVVVGAVLTVRPFTSLSVLAVVVAAAAIVTGATEMLSPHHGKRPWLDVTAGAIWVIVGVARLAWPGVMITVIMLWAALGLMVGGILRAHGGLDPYLIGQGEARSVLGAVRAAKQIPGVDLANETVVWGHSQGGHAALWAGMIAPRHAPDVHVAGVAVLAPASNVNGLVASVNALKGGSVLASYVAAAYSAIYPDVSFRQYIRPAARPALRAEARFENKPAPSNC